MNLAHKPARLLLPLALLTTLGVADPQPGPLSQPQPRLTKGAQGTFIADWTGVAGRTYFFQWSTDLANWYYAPFIDFGDGEHSHGLASTSAKGFFRLHHTDDPEITNLEDAQAADFDSDGLGNLFEVTYGYSPFDPESTAGGLDASLDPDLDGMANSTEQSQARDPMQMDNPKLMLQVTAE